MNPEQQRIAIAEACGWKPVRLHWEKEINGETISAYCDVSLHSHRQLPDYLNDLNAMHEAEQLVVYRDEHQGGLKYSQNLRRITEADKTFERWQWGATAAQRAEAFLRTLNLWTDEKT